MCSRLLAFARIYSFIVSILEALILEDTPKTGTVFLVAEACIRIFAFAEVRTRIVRISPCLGYSEPACQSARARDSVRNSDRAESVSQWRLASRVLLSLSWRRVGVSRILLREGTNCVFCHVSRAVFGTRSWFWEVAWLGFYNQHTFDDNLSSTRLELCSCWGYCEFCSTYTFTAACFSTSVVEHPRHFCFHQPGIFCCKEPDTENWFG